MGGRVHECVREFPLRLLGMVLGRKQCEVVVMVNSRVACRLELRRAHKPAEAATVTAATDRGQNQGSVKSISQCLVS